MNNNEKQAAAHILALIQRAEPDDVSAIQTLAISYRTLVEAAELHYRLATSKFLGPRRMEPADLPPPPHRPTREATIASLAEQMGYKNAGEALKNRAFALAEEPRAEEPEQAAEPPFKPDPAIEKEEIPPDSEKIC